MANVRRQGRYWLLTIPRDAWEPSLPSGIAYLRGQAEIGESTGYSHWQILAVAERKISCSGIKRLFCSQAHCELSRSEAADEYVWKESTRVEGSQFELGTKPIRRQVSTDWERVWEAAKAGDIMAIPASVRVQHYRTLRTIHGDYSQTVGMQRVCFVFYGPTGTGKSRRAWDEAGMDAYSKDPRSKFWDGYRGEENVVIDEFRGSIDISHVLRWFDRYPVRVEVKGSSTPLCAKRVWITSNLHPMDWYKDLDATTYLALERRLTVIKME